MANNKYIKNNIFNDDFYLDIYDHKLEKLIHKNIVAEEMLNDICEYNDYDIDKKYNEREISLQRIKKHIHNVNTKNKHIFNTLSKLDEEMSDEEYIRFEKEQWMNKHKYTYYYEFNQVLDEIKNYVPFLIEGKAEFYKLQGYKIDPKLIQFDNKKYI